jgi:hypothetical protein
MKFYSYLLIIFNIVMIENSFAQETMLLECSGYRWMETNNSSTEKTKIVQTYEIKNKKLVLSENEKYHLEAVSFGNNEILYSTWQHPIISIIQNYYLQFDRISGIVKEQYDTYPPSKGIISYWKFEGLCRKTLRKF